MTAHNAESVARPHPAVAVIDGIVEHVRAIEKLVQPGDGEFYLRTLLKVYEWALAQQPFRAGDRVKLRHDLDLSSAPGYRPYADLLVEGAPGVVDHIDFNGAWSKWQAGVKFDADEQKRIFTVSQGHLAHIDGTVCG